MQLYTVVDLPEPVGPVTMMTPDGASRASSMKRPSMPGSIPSSCMGRSSSWFFKRRMTICSPYTVT